MNYTRNEELLSNLGYKVEKDGKCISKTSKELNAYNTNGYKIINARIDKKLIKVPVHRLQAYQKFGNQIYEEGMMIRHLDNNPLNNSWDNLGIGTNSDNMMDQPKEQRIKKASNANKKYSDELVMEIKAYHNSGYSYKEIMEKYNISSKGTISNIINNR